MATDASQSPIQSFYEFLGRRLDAGATDLTPAESVREFELYQEELRRLVDETRCAAEQSRRGDTRPLDVDAIMQRVRVARVESNDQSIFDEINTNLP